MSGKRYRLTAAKEYESGGQSKTTWVNLGTLWLHEDGKISGVLETVPVGPWFDGRIHAFRADEDGGRAGKGAKHKPKHPQDYATGDLDDEIPF